MMTRDQLSMRRASAFPGLVPTPSNTKRNNLLNKHLSNSNVALSNPSLAKLPRAGGGLSEELSELAASHGDIVIILDGEKHKPRAKGSDLHVISKKKRRSLDSINVPTKKTLEPDPFQHSGSGNCKAGTLPGSLKDINKTGTLDSITE